MEKAEIIKKCKTLAMENYEKGMDAIVECWEDSDWEDLYFDNKGSYPRMKKAMLESAGLWIEQNLNARWGEDTDPQLDMLPDSERPEYTLTDEEKAKEADMSMEWGCLRTDRTYSDGMMGYNSYEECCNAHALGIIDMDGPDY